LINLEDIGGYSANSKLKDYEGKNPYIKKMKKKLIKDGKITLTEAQRKYILDNYDNEPMLINKVVNISEFLGEALQQQEKLTFKPERILIEFMLADSEKAYHVYGKLTRKQEKSGMYFLPKTQVMDDPYFIDSDIDVDFEKYEKLDQFVDSEGKVGRTILEHQKSGVKFLLSRNGAILADDMGLGKVIANDIPVLTPHGWVPHGTLKEGDYVIGSNGKPTKVLKTFPKPLKNYYNITFTDGTVVESCDEHLWAVQTTNHKKRNNGYKVKELKELMGDLTYGTKNNVKWYIPMVKPVEFEKSSLNIDPYVMGCLLGDGGFSSHNIRFTSNDLEIIKEMNSRLPLGHELKQFKIMEYHLCGVKNTNLVIREFNEFGLMGLKSENKFIPKPYLFSDINDRLDLLQGLLDTDGYCGKDGTIQYYSVSKNLTNSVKELVNSFGGVARQSSKIGKYKLPDGTIKHCKECFILTINLPKDIIPFKLERKIKNMKSDRKYLPSRGIKSIEFSRKTYGQCISVEAQDQLYVIDKYVVTHNTMQSVISAIECGAKKILIVCPSSAKINWEREINYFQEEDIAIISGSRWSHAKFTIINFDILKNFHTLKDDNNDGMPAIRDLVNAKFDLCIIDEAHNLRNHKSIRGAIMTELCVDYGIEKVWLLSGTPVANRPMDFYNLLKLIKSPLVDNWKFYVQRYCEGRQITQTLKNRKKRKIWLTNGASNLDELSIKTRNLLLRRMKDEVLDMPDKIRVPNYLKMSSKQQLEYDSLWEDYLIERKKQKKKGSIQRDLVELGLLRKYIAMETIPETISLVDEVIEQGHKVIIFTCFTDELHALAEHYGNNCVIHYGEMNEKEKQKSVDKFQLEGGPMVFIGNIISAGVAITLTRSTYVVFNSFDWVPGNSEQAEDRSYRLGQKNNVTVYYNLFEDTIVSKMWHTLNRKKSIINQIMSRNDNNSTAVDEIVDYTIENKNE
jgi:hypothetical protein